MVRDAINAHPAFANYMIKVYAKGSYPNNTNVKNESDVDIAVQCSDGFYWEPVSPDLNVPVQSYTGPWSGHVLRSEVEKALNAKFPGQVDSSGNIAIKVASSTAREDADVIPCYDYRYYFSSHDYREGIRIFPRQGNVIINYPQQHLQNGRDKNERTNHNFKKVVRILKRTANAMETGGAHQEVASCLVESLVYNCPDSNFMAPTWTGRVGGVIAHILNNTQGDVEPADALRWLEVDGCKYLFSTSQSWSRSDARDFAWAAWNYLGLAQA